VYLCTGSVWMVSFRRAAVVVCSRTQLGGIVCACRDGKENTQYTRLLLAEHVLGWLGSIVG
jgi:hypothetical protein